MKTIREAALLLGVHPETLRRWDRSGKLKAVIINDRGDRRYREEDLSPYCHHQWFEMKKISGFTDHVMKANKKIFNDYINDVKDLKPGIWPLGPFLLPEDKFGVLVKCANCKQEKQLWESEKQ